MWGLRVGQRNVIPAWVGASNHELSLNERSGWVNMRSGHAPTTTEMLRLFTSISGIFIRGGYYTPPLTYQLLSCIDLTHVCQVLRWTRGNMA